jgi:hypothetical protein
MADGFAQEREQAPLDLDDRRNLSETHKQVAVNRRDRGEAGRAAALRPARTHTATKRQ